MKRFLRYLLLVICLMLFTALITSYFKKIVIFRIGMVYALGAWIDSGNMQFFDSAVIPSPGDFPAPFYIRLGTPINDLPQPSESILSIAGLIYAKVPLKGTFIVVPIYLLLIPLGFVAARLWYPVIKSYKQGTNRKGFEVELKPESKDHGQDDHATE